MARRRTYGTDLDEASPVTDHSPLACRYVDQLYLLFVWHALRAIATNTVPLEITLGYVVWPNGSVAFQCEDRRHYIRNGN